MTRVALFSLWTAIDKPGITCQKMISHPLLFAENWFLDRTEKLVIISCFVYFSHQQTAFRYEVLPAKMLGVRYCYAGKEFS